jgi:hypothetical protein
MPHPLKHPNVMAVSGDIGYKACLFELLTQHSQSPLSVGEHGFGFKQEQIKFELMLENDCREKLPEALKP